MNRIRVYLDTSVFGGVGDEEFAEASQRFFHNILRGRYVVLISTETVRELQTAPESVKALLKEIPPECLERTDITPETEALADAYVLEGVVGRASESDALHVAAATIARADVILSWNFKHIVNYDRIHKYNGVNALKGYPPIEIHSPLELADGDEDEDI